jgi:hypothetical protein
MDQLSFPPHLKSDDCPPCRKFAYRPSLCTRCSDGRLHVLRDFTEGATGEKKLRLQCSNCRYEGVGNPP